MISTILMATDGSEPALSAERYAASLAARLRARSMSAHDVDRARVIDRHRREAGMMANGLDINRPSIHGKTALGQPIVHEILRRALLSAQAREPHQVLGQSHLGVEPGLDRSQDLGGKARVECLSGCVHASLVHSPFHRGARFSAKALAPSR